MVQTFQYISCYSLSQSARSRLRENRGFNTSHVTLYLEQNRDCQQFNHVSIHLMLLFIYILFGTLCTTAPVSIHLMLLFISKHFHIYQIFYKFQYISCYSLSTQKGIQEKRSRTFQYISCYSLSLDAVLGRENYIRFNTSHVTLYLITMYVGENETLFQYISCYSLSWLHHWSMLPRKEFQYISCYSLSNIASMTKAGNKSFNTSHVTLYQKQRE